MPQTSQLSPPPCAPTLKLVWAGEASAGQRETGAEGEERELSWRERTGSSAEDKASSAWPPEPLSAAVVTGGAQNGTARGGRCVPEVACQLAATSDTTPVSSALDACIVRPLLQTSAWLGRACVLLLTRRYRLSVLLTTLRRYFLGGAGRFLAELVAQLTVQREKDKPGCLPGRALDIALRLADGGEADQDDDLAVEPEAIFGEGDCAQHGVFACDEHVTADACARSAPSPSYGKARWRGRAMQRDEGNGAQGGLRLEPVRAAAELLRVGSLDHLRLSLRVPPPLHTVVGDVEMGRYNDIFLFLLKMKHVAAAIRAMWHGLHLRRSQTRDLASAHNEHRMRLHVYELGGFASALEVYFVTHVVEDCWATLQHDLAQAASVSDLRGAHERYVLAAWRHCLLHPEGEQVSELILAIIALLLRLQVAA